MSSAQVKPLTDCIDYWNSADLSVWGYDLTEPVEWRGVRIVKLRWEGYWQLAVEGVLPESSFLFDLAHISWLEIVHNPMGFPSYRDMDVGVRLHGCTVEEKWSADLVTFGGIEPATIRVQFRIDRLEVVGKGAE
jgi:hypothetical protein